MNRNGKSLLLSPEEVMAHRFNSWKGWSCSAGIENIYVSHDGNVYVGTCKVGGMICNIFDGLHEFPQQWTVCNKEWCMCGQDMQLRKTRRKELIPKCYPPTEESIDHDLKDFDWVMPYHFDSFKRFPKFVTWDLGRRCNYSCHYCHPSISNTYESHKSWGSLKFAVDTIVECFTKEEKARWIFTGGEPTINPHFMTLVKYLYERGHSLHTQTNAGRHFNYYAELIEYSSIGISLHLKYYRESSFLKTCQAIIDKKRDNENAARCWFGIRIMVPPKMLQMALDIKSSILALPGFEDFQHIHLSPLYKTGVNETDQMLEYDKDEHNQIIAHA